MPGSEFQLIKTFFAEPEQLARTDLVLGIGDDCAVVAPEQKRHLAFSIDTLICGVHFPENTQADAVAYKSLAVNLSDLAAMGAEPAWFTLSLTLPGAGEWDDAYRQHWLAEFSRSLFALARSHNIHLIGGDTTRGPLSVTIQVAGYLPENRVLKRSGAHQGDIIAVTGALGAAAMGLDLLLEKNSEYYIHSSDAHRQSAIKALNYPDACIDEGLALLNIAHSALDISDGLLADLGHILSASGVGAEVYLEQIPLADALSAVDKQLAREKALSGGDDYELCFTLAEKDWLLFQHQYPGCSAIGRITATQTLRILTANGEQYAYNTIGYDHFG